MKTKLITILMISVLFIVSCGGGEPPKTTGGAFIGGTEGVVAQFEAFGIEEEGLDTIFDTDTFAIDVTLRNRGEYEIKPGDVMVKLLGPAEEEFSGIASYNLQNSNVIEKISDLVVSGGEETISFASDAKFEGEVLGLLDREWYANIDYKYQTLVVIPEVCLKEDPTDDRVCEVAEKKIYSVSGAPVTVDSVEESTAGRGIMALKILISKRGTGKVAKLGEDFGSRDGLTYTIDDPAWECKSSGKVGEARLALGTTEIVCRLKEALAKDTPPSTKQLKLTMDYQYRDLVQQTLRMKQSAK